MRCKEQQKESQGSKRTQWQEQKTFETKGKSSKSSGIAPARSAYLPKIKCIRKHYANFMRERQAGRTREP
jgi:hypothetical protein